VCRGLVLDRDSVSNHVG